MNKIQKLLQKAVKHQLITSIEAQQCLQLLQSQKQSSISDILHELGLEHKKIVAIEQLDCSTTRMQKDIDASFWDMEKKPASQSFTGILKAGQYLGNYKIIEELGRGGMGIVYKAHQKNPERIVAIKIMYGVGVEEEDTQRFLREARLAAQMEHSNIVKVYDAGKENNILYLVMAYIEGIELNQYLQGNSLSIQNKVKLLEQIARGLEYAHKNKIIHRDIKPANIMVTQQGIPMVMDFGLAKGIKIDKQLTQAGQIIGSPRYMSPEQLEGRASTDYRTDIYSLGVILYEIIAGQKMTGGNSELEILYNIQNKKPIPLRQINRKVSKSLEAIWLKATERNRNKRYPSVRIFINDLRNFQQKRPVSALKSKPVLPIVIAIVLALICLFFLIPDAKDKRKNIIVDNLLLEKIEMMRRLVVYREYEKVIAHYQELSPKMRLNPNIYLAVAKSHYYLNHYKEARHYLDNITTKEPFIDSEKYYYRGLLNFHQKNYSDALDDFKNSYKLAKTKMPEQLSYYLGRCYFEQSSNSKSIYNPALLKLARKHLLSAKEKFTSVTRKSKAFVTTCEYLGRVELHLENAQEAEKNFFICLELQPYTPKYHTWYGWSLVKSKKYKAALAAFEEACKLGSKDTTPIDGYIKINHVDVNLRQICLEKLIYHVNHRIFSYSSPDLLEDGFKKFISNHESLYQQVKTLQIASGFDQQKGIETLLSGLESDNEQIRNLAISGLKALRYNSNIHNIIEQKLESIVSPQIEDLIKQVNDSIIEQKRKELRHIRIYKMARIYLENNAEMKAEFKSSLREQRILMRIAQTNNNSIICYLAAKTLLSLKKAKVYYRLRQIYRSIDTQVMQKTLIALALKEEDYTPVVGGKLIRYAVKSSDPFLRRLLARNIIPKNRALLRLLDDKDKYVRFYAATVFIRLSLRRKDKQYRDKARKILEDGLSDTNAIFREFSHYHFWQIRKLGNSSPSLLAEHLNRGLKDPEEKVQFITLAMTKSWAAKSATVELEKLARSSPNVLIRLQAIDRLATWPYGHCNAWLKQIAHDPDSPIFIRLFAFLHFVEYNISPFRMSSITRQNLVKEFVPIADMNTSIRDKNLGSLVNSFIKLAKQRMESLQSDPVRFAQFKKEMGLDRFTKELHFFCHSSEPQIRGMALGFANFAGLDMLKYLSQEKDQEVLASILFNIASKSELLFNLDNYQHNPKEYYQAIEKFISHPSENLKKSAAIAKTMYTINFAPEKATSVITSLKALSDPTIKSGAALGIYLALQQKTVDFLSYVMILGYQYPFYYEYYLEKLHEATVQSKDSKYYIKWLNHVIELDDLPLYRYERSILYKKIKDYKAAMQDIEVALQINSDNPHYQIEKAHILFLQNKKNEATKNILQVSNDNLDNIKILRKTLKIFELLKNKKQTLRIKKYIKVLDPKSTN